MKRNYTLPTESEVISGSSDPIRASKGLGDGFNSHAGTGTIASASTQRKQSNRGESAFLRTALTSQDIDGAVKQALPLAVITEVLRTFDVTATWTVDGEFGAETVDPRNAIDSLSRAGATLKVDLHTEIPAEQVVGLLDAVHASCISHLDNIDNLDGAHPGQGRAFYALMAASSVFAMSIGRKGSALARLVADAKAALAAQARVNSGSVLAAPAADLESCPVCKTTTGRTDLVCRNGHRTAAAIRSEQEIFVLAAAHKAAKEAGLTLAVQAKTKGTPRFEIVPDSSAALLVSLQDVSAKVSFDAPLQVGDLSAAWTNLARTSSMRTVLDATILSAAAGAEVRTRVLRAVNEAIDKAANAAAEVIADDVRTQMAHMIVAIEREKSALAWQRAEAEYRKVLLAKAAGPVSDKQLRNFVDETNKHRRFVGPKGPKGPQGRRRFKKQSLAKGSSRKRGKKAR